jgi:hypothetical protein
MVGHLSNQWLSDHRSTKVSNFLPLLEDSLTGISWACSFIAALISCAARSWSSWLTCSWHQWYKTFFSHNLCCGIKPRVWHWKMCSLFYFFVTQKGGSPLVGLPIVSSTKSADIHFSFWLDLAYFILQLSPILNCKDWTFKVFACVKLCSLYCQRVNYSEEVF